MQALFAGAAPHPSSLSLCFWWIAGGAGVGYLALFFLARRSVSLRSGRLSGVVAAVLALRLALVAAGHPLESGYDRYLVGTALLFALCLRSGARIWLLRATEEDLRRQIVNTCRGLFLECQEPLPGRFLLSARGHAGHLRMRGVSRRIQLLLLPRLSGPGKAVLLIHWLSKQYPGPVPRVRRVLKRRKP